MSSVPFGEDDPIGMSSEEWLPADGLADEIVENVGGRPHDASRMGITEMAFHANVLAERGTSAHAHRELDDLDRVLGRRGLAGLYSEQGVWAAAFQGQDRVAEQAAGHVGLHTYSGDVVADRRQIGEGGAGVCVS